jgi:hypothetical protein
MNLHTIWRGAVVTTVTVAIGGCGDSPVGPQTARYTGAVAAAGVKHGPKTINVGTAVLTFENDTIRNASGTVLWPLPDSIIQTINNRRAKIANTALLLKRFEKDTAHQRRVADARGKGLLHRPASASATLGGVVRFEGGIATFCAEEDWENDYWACFDEQQSGGGSGTGGGYDPQTCTNLSIDIYESTQTYNEDLAEMNSASLNMLLDALALFVAIAEEDVPGQIRAAAAFLTDSYAFYSASSRVDSDLARLNWLAGRYYTAGC